MVEVIDTVLTSTAEKTLLISKLQKLGLTLEDIPQNLHSFHEALESAFGTHHFSVENLIIKTLHEKTKQGIYSEKDAAVVAIRLIDVFTKEHKKDLAAAKEELNQNRQNLT